MGNTLLWFGELGSARIHLEKGIALYQPEWSRSWLSILGLTVLPVAISFWRACSGIWATPTAR
jgi:hypothetical protein